MLSKKAKYGIRALLYLAERRGKGPILIRDIATSERLPQKFLEAILLELKSGGILRSRAGRAGGYEMIKDPKDVSLGLVIRLIDGPLAPIPCVSQMAYAPCDDCVDEKTCLIRLAMKEVRDSTSLILEGMSIKAMLQRKQELAELHAPSDYTI